MSVIAVVMVVATGVLTAMITEPMSIPLYLLPHLAWLGVIVWFPERLLGMFVLAAYLFVWLPWGCIYLPMHVLFLSMYMVYAPLLQQAPFIGDEQLRQFAKKLRGLAIWRWVRARWYPNTLVCSPYGSHLPDPAHPTLYAVVPHGVYFEAGNLTLVANTALMRNATFMGSSVLWWVPFVKELVMAAGARIISADNIDTELRLKRRDIVMVPEGLRGAICEQDRGALPERKGFIRCAAFSAPERAAMSFFRRCAVVPTDATAGDAISPLGAVDGSPLRHMHSTLPDDDALAVSSSNVRIVPIYIENTFSIFSYWPGPLYTRENSVFRRFQHWCLSSPLMAPPVAWFGRWGTIVPYPEQPGRPLTLYFGPPIYCAGKTVNDICIEYTRVVNALTTFPVISSMGARAADSINRLLCDMEKED